MSFLKEFKEFVNRGNVIDLAVAVVIGAAFGKIISALVSGILMPFIGLILGGINITDKVWKIGDAAIKWGAFLQSIVDFLIIAFSIFVAIKLMTKLQRPKPVEPPKKSNEEVLLIEIRDLLKQNLDRSQHDV